MKLPILLWVATGSGLFRLNTDTFRFEKMPIDHFIRVHDMLEDGYGNIVVVDSDGGVFVVNKVTGKFKTYPIYGVKAFRDYQKNIWIGQWRGESNLIKFQHPNGVNAKPLSTPIFGLLPHCQLSQGLRVIPCFGSDYAKMGWHFSI